MYDRMYFHDLPLDQLIPEWDRIDSNGTDLAAIRALCLTDLYYLLVKVCKRTDMLHPWVLDRCREVEFARNGYLDLWAREHFKSSIITQGCTIQSILHNREVRICIFSHTHGIASAFLVMIKETLERNETLKAAFPDVLYQDPAKDSPLWTQSAFTVIRDSNAKEATVEAAGLIDGMPVSKHYDELVFDDCVVPASVSTQDQVNKTTQSFELALSLGHANSVIRIIGTRYAVGDTYQWIINERLASVRIYSATDDGTMSGNPVMLPQHYWEKILKRSDFVVACQYLQNPLQGSTRMFDVNDVQRYEVRPPVINVYILADPARSKKKRSDKTAMAVIGVDPQMNLFLLDGFNHRMDLTERWDALKHLYRKWSTMQGVQNVVVGYEAYGALADLDYFENQMQQFPAQRFKIEQLTKALGSEQNKGDRVQRLTPDLKMKKLFVPYPTTEKTITSIQQRYVDNGLSFLVSRQIKQLNEDKVVYNLVRDLLQQIEFFPLGDHDDLIDAVARIHDIKIQAPLKYHNSNLVVPDELLV